MSRNRRARRMFTLGWGLLAALVLVGMVAAGSDDGLFLVRCELGTERDGTPYLTAGFADRSTLDRFRTRAGPDVRVEIEWVGEDGSRLATTRVHAAADETWAFEGPVPAGTPARFRLTSQKCRRGGDGVANPCRGHPGR